MYWKTNRNERYNEKNGIQKNGSIDQKTKIKNIKKLITCIINTTKLIKTRIKKLKKSITIIVVKRHEGIKSYIGNHNNLIFVYLSD